MTDDTTTENGTLTKVETDTNVIDFATKQALLPAQVRAAIIGQYAESVALNHNPVKFVNSLEKRLLTDLTYAGAQIIKGMFGGNND